MRADQGMLCGFAPLPWRASAYGSDEGRSVRVQNQKDLRQRWPGLLRLGSRPFEV